MIHFILYLEEDATDRLLIIDIKQLVLRIKISWSRNCGIWLLA